MMSGERIATTRELMRLPGSGRIAGDGTRPWPVLPAYRDREDYGVLEVVVALAGMAGSR
jgi:hypothetical protein